MRLLVAVSNEPLAHAIRGALLAGRHEVSLASTGSIALAAVAKESFDAVILDESLLGISVVPELLRTLVFARPCGGDQFAAGTVSPSLDMSR